MQKVEQHACFGGVQEVWEHDSKTLGCSMRFSVFLPPQVHTGACPAVYWLSGLTCNEQNFITKAGAQRDAAALGLVLVAPDTSPRGEDVPNDPAYDLGQGAGFYLNASQAPWSSNYRMYDYVRNELPALIEAHFPVNDKRSIFGHSMGGHGALVLALKNPDFYQSVSACSPIVAPSQVPWGIKAFTAYLGEDQTTWAEWDTCALVATNPQTKEHTKRPLLVDFGEADDFLQEQLRPELLEQACKQNQHPLQLQLHPGYDHSYYFIASVMPKHLQFHAQALQ